LRAFTARDQKAVRAAAETFRANPQIDTVTAITELGKGEALVSFLEGNGVPAMVERVLICPPTARVGPVTPEERAGVMKNSPVKGKYDTPVDPESAFEMLQKRTQETMADEEAAPAGGGKAGEPEPEEQGGLGGFLGSIFGTTRKRGQRLSTGQTVAREVTRTVFNRVAGQVAADLGKSLGGKMGGSVGRAIVRGALGGILRR